MNTLKIVVLLYYCVAFIGSATILLALNMTLTAFVSLCVLNFLEKY